MGATKILIVEDEPNMVAGLRDNFEYEGFQVLTALDGVEGLESALKDSPDLVVLDVMMPRMSGLDVCKAAEGEAAFDSHHHADCARAGSGQSSGSGTGRR